MGSRTGEMIMEVIFAMVILVAMLTSIFGFLIYAEIKDLRKELEWESSFNGDIMNQLKDIRYEVEEMKRKEDKWTIRKI
jgi:hypothetical protein